MDARAFKRATDRQLYNHAVEQLECACNQLDQAHATLRDVQMHHHSIKSGHSDVTIAGVFRLASTLLDSLKHADCDTCWKAITDHPVPGCPQWKE